MSKLCQRDTPHSDSNHSRRVCWAVRERGVFMHEIQELTVKFRSVADSSGRSSRFTPFNSQVAPLAVVGT
jgi:hypothetical protein